MPFLLDTSILIWCLENNQKKLSKEVIEIVSDLDNEIYVSSVSTWEISIKSSLGKLKISEDVLEVIYSKAYKILNITPEHTLYVSELKDIHNDPFDRLLIAQSILHNMKLITSDKVFLKYPVSLIFNE